MRSKIQKEKRIVEKMIRIYCKHKEGNAELCANCTALLNYAYTRLDRCPHGEEKPACRNCRIHCYRKDMQQQIRTVMRFSGPRILFYHPIVAIKHYLGLS